MNYGLYLSAAGVLTSIHRQDVLSNNLANMNTAGFKPNLVTVRERLPERLERPSLASPKLLLEQLGGGLFINPTRVDLEQGSITPTGGELDLAIKGDGFFVVDTGPRRGAPQLRLTRDGRLTLNERGELITAGDGYRVMSSRHRPIRVDPEVQVAINGAGEVIQDGFAVARLRIADVPDPQQLTKVGDNLLRLKTDGDARTLPAGTGTVQQRFVESSAVDPITTLNHLTNAAKAAQANIKMMQYHDNLLGQTFNTFGRVA